MNKMPSSVIQFYFVVQGEGRGHLSQALALKQQLIARGHKVVGVSVGKSSVRKIPDYFYRKIEEDVHHFKSPNFVQNSSKTGILVWKSLLKGFVNVPTYYKEVKRLRKKIEESGAQAVVNFYEPLCGVLQFFKPLAIPVFGVGHQYLVRYKDFFLPKGIWVDKLGLQNLTNVASLNHQKLYALSFYTLPEQEKLLVVPPLFREELYQKEHLPTENHYLIYLLNRGYAKEVINWHSKNSDISLVVFWDAFDMPEVYKPQEGLVFHHLNDELFLEKMASCKALLTTSGFESICEAMYLKKPVMMVPSQGHYEQLLNSFDALKAGAGVRAENFDVQELFLRLTEFLKSDNSDHEKVNQCWLRYEVHPMVLDMEEEFYRKGT